MAMTMGMVFVAPLAANAAGVPCVTMTSTLSRTSSPGQGREPIIVAVGPSILDPDVAALDVAVIPQPEPERLDQRRVSRRRRATEKADHPRLPGRLRLGRAGRREDRQTGRPQQRAALDHRSTSIEVLGCNPARG